MKKILKITGLILLIPVILFAIAAFGLASIDLNNYRSDIEKLVADNTGRQLSLKGDLKKSFFPWLGVDVGEVSLSNAGGFEPPEFASVSNVEIKIDTLSLLKLEPKISRIIVKGLTLNLSKNNAGKTNWEDLSGAAQAKPADSQLQGETHPDSTGTTGSAPLALINIAGLDIENANISWDDQQAGTRYSVKQLNLSVSEIAVGKPIALKLDFGFESQQPALNAKVKLASDRLEWDIKEQRYAVSPLMLSVEATGEGLPVSPLSAQLQLVAVSNLARQLLKIDSLVLNTSGLTLNAKATVTQFMETPDYQADIELPEFNPRTLIQTLKLKLPATSDEKVLTSAALKTNVKGNTEQVEVSGLLLSLDDTKVNADASVRNFGNPVIRASLELDQINLDRYLPLPVEEPASMQDDAGETAKSGQAQPLPIPVELIRGLDVDANIKAGKVVIRELDINDVTVKARVKEKVANINPVSLKVAQGSINSSIRLDVTKSIPMYTVKHTIDQAQAAPLVKAVAGKDYVSGMLMLKAAVESRGMMLEDVKKNLNGNLSFLFKNGAVKGVNLAEKLREVEAKLRKAEYQESADARTTDFAELGGSATIKNGVVTNRDLAAKSPLLRVEGKGKVDLVAENLDYLVTTYLVGTSKGQGGKSIEELRGIPVPIQLTGPFSNIEWDYKWSVITRAIKEKLKKQAKEKVGDKVEAKKEAAKQKLDEKKEEKKEEIKEKAKEKLKKLFKF